MNKRENVINLLAGRDYDFVPAGFWIHFDEEINQGSVEDKAQAHLNFAQESDLSVVKIMNENEFRRDEQVKRASDWANIPVVPKSDKLFTEQREITERTLELLDGEYYTLGTVHGLVASLSHSSGVKYAGSLEVLLAHARENKQAVLDAIKKTTENVIQMVQLMNESDIDGVYYAALGGEKDRLPREFFEEFIAPYDQMIMDEIENKSLFLHICKNDIDFDRFKNYPADVVNWAIHETDLDLVDGKELFADQIILGGMDDRSGVLVEGDESQIKAEIDRIVSVMDGRPFILGADCTLPTDIDYDRIRLASQYAKEFKINE